VLYFIPTFIEYIRIGGSLVAQVEKTCAMQGFRAMQGDAR